MIDHRPWSKACPAQEIKLVLLVVHIWSYICMLHVHACSYLFSYVHNYVYACMYVCTYINVSMHVCMVDGNGFMHACMV